MALSAGTRLGRYEILSALGAGGMGEVYRAKDTRLERTVAIKILPEHLSSNPQLRERFGFDKIPRAGNRQTDRFGKRASNRGGVPCGTHLAYFTFVH